MNGKNFVLQAILSIALMTGSGSLLTWTLNTLGATAGALSVMALVMIAVLVFMTGVVWMGRLAYNASGYTRPHHRYRVDQGVVFALTIIAAGALLLAFNTGFLPVEWKGFFFSWPMLLFLFGAVSLCKLNFTQGVILAAVGKFFLIDKLSLIYPQDDFYERFTSIYWPVLIIIVGLLIFVQFLFKPKTGFFYHHRGNSRRRFEENHCETKEKNGDGAINYSYIFSGTEDVFLEPEFKGGAIDTIFGGVNLDLRRTSLPEGETRLHIHTLFGGVEISMPPDWYVEVNPQTIFGGVNNMRTNHSAVDKSRKLIIDACCEFGGITLR
jgi:predicted membrane protein